MLAVFVGQTAEDVETICSAVDAGDTGKLLQATRRLKGAAATIGLLGVAAIASELEKIGHTGQTDGTEPFVNALHAEAKRIAAMSIKKGGEA